MRSNLSRSNKIVVGLSGASGMPYAQVLLAGLKRLGQQVHLIISPIAAQIFTQEMGCATSVLEQFCAHAHRYDDFHAPMSSGSWPHDGMIICPCSMSTLGHIAAGAGNNLIHRAADVCLKESRKLILAVRESPVNSIHLENMLKLSRCGATIFPLSPSFYHQPSSVDELIRHTCGRIIDQLDLENDLARRWETAATINL